MLALTSCHNGIFRLQSARPISLYLASGLLLIGHGESVVTFFVTTSRRHFRLFGPRFVLGPNTCCSFAFNGSAV